MLQDSLLGKLYNVWCGSRVFALLQVLYRAFARAADGSVILRAVFSEGAPERAYRSSLLCRAVNGVFALARRILSPFAVLAAAADGSAILRAARGSRVIGRFVNFEGLFGAFLLLMFVTPHDYWNNFYTVLGTFVLLALYLLLAADRRRDYAPPELLGPGVPVFLLACLLSIGFSADAADSARILLFFLASFALCYIAAADLRDGERLRRVLALLYLALLVVSLYGIAQRAFGLVRVSSSFTDLELNKGVPGRVFSTLDNPINLSEFILLFMPLGAAFAAGARKPLLRVLLAAGLALPALALLLTYSRGGWLAIVLAAAVFTFCCNKRLIPALFVVGLLALPLLPQSVLIRLSTIGNTADSSTMHRIDIWRGVLALIGDHDRFFTGIGLGPETFRRIYPFYSVGLAKIGAYHSQQHYLELVLETGIVGLLAFLFMMCRWFGRAANALRGAARERRLVLIACISSVCALALVGLVEYIWFYPRIMFAFFLFLGILLAAADGTASE